MHSCERNSKNDNSQPEHSFSQKCSFVENYSKLLHNLKIPKFKNMWNHD